MRERFPAACTQTYLNVGSKSVLSNAARSAALAVLDSTWLGTDRKSSDNEPVLRAVRGKFAQLIGADADDVAITKNVTEGINAVASGIDWKPGDNVVLCEALEHPNNIYAWLALRARGVELRSVAPRRSCIDAEAMCAAIDARSRVVAASSVTFTPGFRTDVDVIGRACRKAGALFLVDGVQSAGVLRLDVEADAIDALATSTSKGLLGVPGLGFLYVRRAWAQRLTPAAIGRYSVVRTGHQSEIESHDFEWLPDARRFEAGNYNWVGIAAADASLSEILATGVDAIERHVVALARELSGGLARLDLPVNQPPEERLRSHLVTVGALGAGGAYETSDPRLNRLAHALVAAGVAFSIRRGLLRFGFHCYNDAGDVERVLEVARATG